MPREDNNLSSWSSSGCCLPCYPGIGCRFPAGHFRGAASSWKHFRGIPCETGTALARETHERSFQGCRTAPWSPNKQTNVGLFCSTAQLQKRQHTAGLTGAKGTRRRGCSIPLPPQLGCSDKGALQSSLAPRASPALVIMMEHT